MSLNKKRLGRGLEALLGVGDELVSSSPQSADGSHTHQGGDLVHLSVYEIEDNPFQPRREFNESEIASLAESLKTHDMLQPILVRMVNGRHQLISGERRLRAAIKAGWTTVPARIREADDRLVSELAIVENLQRKDLNAIEKALSFRRYIDEHGCTQEYLANRLKIDRSTVANLMRLLELPAVVQEAIRKGEISMGHARALLPLGDAQAQIEFCERIHREGLSVRVVESEVSQRIASEDSPALVVAPRPGKPVSPQLDALRQELRRALGTNVDIRQTSRGSGRIIVHFANSREFERLREYLAGHGETRKSA